jgi:hypothetical protein
MMNAPATVAWLAGQTFSDIDLSAPWPWSVSDRGFLLSGWTYVVRSNWNLWICRVHPLLAFI